MQIFIRSLPANLYILLEDDCFQTVGQIKRTIEQQEKINPNDFNLYYKGKLLQPSEALSKYGISNNDTLDFQWKVEDPKRRLTIRKKAGLVIKGTDKAKVNSIKGVADTPVSHESLFEKRLITVKDIQKSFHVEKASRTSGDTCSFTYSDTFESRVTSVAASRDSKFHIIGCHNGIVKLIDFESKIKATEVHVFPAAVPPDGPVGLLTVSADNKWVFSGSDHLVTVYDLESKEKVHQIEQTNPADLIKSMAVSRNSEYVIVGDKNGSIKIAGLKDRTQVKEIRNAHKGRIKCLTVSRDNKFLISGADDGTIKIFDLESASEVYNFQRVHESPVISLNTSRDGKWIISCSMSESLKIFDFQTKEEVILFDKEKLGKRGEGGIITATMCRDNKFLIASYRDLQNVKIRIFNVDARVEMDSLPKKGTVLKRDLSSLFITRDNKSIVSLCSEGVVRVFDFQTKTFVDQRKQGDQSDVVCATLSKDGSLLVSGSAVGNIKGWSLQRKEEVFSFALEDTDILSVKMSRDDKLLVALTTSGTVMIYDIEKKAAVHEINTDPLSLATSVAISRDNKYFIVGFSDYKVKVYDLYTRKIVTESFGYETESGQNSIISLIISRDNQYIIAGTDDGEILVLDLQRRIKVHEFKKAHQRGTIALTISRDNKFIISGALDGTIKIFDLQTKAEIHHFQSAHENIVCSLTMSRDNRFIISGSFDKKIKIFDLRTKKQIYQIENEHGDQHTLCGVAVSNDNKSIISVTINGWIDIMNMPYMDEKKLLFVSSQIPTYSLVPISDKFLSNNLENAPVLMAYHDLYLYPQYWTLLHYLAIFHPSYLSNVLSYQKFKPPFLVDSSNKTPLHYLLEHPKIDYQTANLMFEFIIDYLEDKDNRTFSDFEAVCKSLTNILPTLIDKLDPKLVKGYLKLCMRPSAEQFGSPLPDFGQPLEGYALTTTLVMQPEIQQQIFKEGNEKIIFWTTLLYLDYNKKSDDTLQTIGWLSSVKDEEIYKSAVISNLIDFLWNQTYPALLFLGALFSLFMILISVYVGIGDRILPLEIIILVLAAVFLLFESMQMFSLKKEYIKNLWNCADVIFLLLVFTLIILKLADSDNELASHWISSLVIIIGYSRWVSYLRLFNPTRTLIQVIISIIHDMLGFMLVLVFIILGFSLVFFEFNRDNQYPDHLYGAYKLLYGDSDDSEYGLSQKLLSAFILFLVNIVLLNLLISIMGDSYDRTQERRVFTDSQTRLEMMQEVLILIRAITGKQSSGKGYLTFCRPYQTEEQQDDPAKSEWEGRVNVIKKALKQTESKMGGDMKQMRQEIEKLVLQTETRMQQEISRVEKLVLQSHGEIIKAIKDHIGTK